MHPQTTGRSHALSLALSGLMLLSLALVSCAVDSGSNRTDSGASPDLISTEDASVDRSTPARSDGGGDATIADATEGDQGSSAPAFVYQGKEQPACPLSADTCASNWPTPEQGAVYLHRSQETFGDKVHPRQFWVYVPEALPAGQKVPLVILLHGGTGNAMTWFERPGVLKLADARGAAGLPWLRNTESCKYVFTNLLAKGFRDAAGDKCTPEVVAVNNSQRFVVVMPDGILDAGATGDTRHWEDGRDPSPGHDVTEPQRDDVGFIDHLIGELVAREAAILDPGRIYLSGASNGGMMTQRVLCSVTDPAYPNLRRIAAAAPTIAAMSEPIADGLAGRPRCNASGPVALPIVWVMGNGIDTPDCEPYGCKQPLVNGDGFVPFGQAGGRYFIASPDGGRATSAADALAHWQAYNEAAGGGAASTVSEPLGDFTTVSRTTYADSPAEIRFFEVDGGHHLNHGVRGDFNIWGQIFDFMFRYRRHPSGQLSLAKSSGVSGEI